MPVLIVAFLMILVLVFLLVTAYFSVAVMLKLFRVIFETFRTSSLPHSVTKSLQEAREYAGLIKKMVQQQPSGPMQDRLDRMIKPVDEWLMNLNRLEQALIKMYFQRNLSRELRRVSFEVEQLRRELLTITDEDAPSVRALMKSKQKHHTTLKALQSVQNQTELRIRKIASDLGATHAEMLLVIAKGDFNDNRFKRLDENLQDNLHGLRDIMAAMDEMGYSSSAAG
jgi:hypothetical protein